MSPVTHTTARITPGWHCTWYFGAGAFGFGFGLPAASAHAAVIRKNAAPTRNSEETLRSRIRIMASRSLVVVSAGDSSAGLPLP